MSSKELLGEYAKLNQKIQHINETLQEMNAVDIAQLIDKMRIVERKMGLVYTLFKSSIYSVGQQLNGQDEGEEEEEEQGEQGEQNQNQQQESSQGEEQYQEEQGRRSLQSQSQSQSEQEGPEGNERFQLYSEQGRQLRQPRRLSAYNPSSQFRRSIYNSGELNSTNNNNGDNINSDYSNNNNPLRSSQSRTATTPSLNRSQSVLRVSNANAARDEFQSRLSNGRSALSVSRGYGSSRWSMGGAGGRDNDSQTNRPRYNY
ncbi:hypothetical protein BGZ76_002048 [Entomortierella beljakovae]|nr:hypothetical protein BGZ76_002048 [Entomortierella beljakovae]